MNIKNNIIPNDYQTGKYLIDSYNYTFKQLQYLYLPIEDVPNPRPHEIYKLLEKVERIDDWVNAYKIMDKWGAWCCEHDT